MQNSIVRFVAAMVAMTSAACAAGTDSDDGAEALGTTQQAVTLGTVTFANCTEIVAYVSVPVANVRDKVPSQFALGNETTGTTELVLRIAKCAETSIDGRTRPTVYAQIGVVIDSPDGTGTANTYELALTSDNPHLVNLAKAAGVTEAKVNHEDVSYTDGPAPGTRLVSAHIAAPYESPFEISATSPIPNAAFPNFVANWWEESSGTVTLLQNVLPSVQLGFCSGSVTFQAGSELARIAGSTTRRIDGLCLHNDYAGSTMTVTQ